MNNTTNPHSNHQKLLNSYSVDIYEIEQSEKYLNDETKKNHCFNPISKADEILFQYIDKL